MKKIISTVLILMLAFCLAACGGKEDSSGSPSEKEESLGTAVEDNGIEKKEYMIDDHTFAVKLVNNTGEDIGLDVVFSYIDEDSETYGVCEQPYLPTGGAYIFAQEAESAIQSYEVTYDIVSASPSVKEYYEKTPYTITEDEFGALEYVLTDNTQDGYNDELTIFYEDEAGNILGYDYIGYGGSGDYYNTFDAPGYEYDKYEVIRTKI